MPRQMVHPARFPVSAVHLMHRFHLPLAASHRFQPAALVVYRYPKAWTPRASHNSYNQALYPRPQCPAAFHHHPTQTQAVRLLSLRQASLCFRPTCLLAVCLVCRSRTACHRLASPAFRLPVCHLVSLPDHHQASPQDYLLAFQLEGRLEARVRIVRQGGGEPRCRIRMKR